jgi:predicted GNAT superfamily acetyltransferase
MLRDATPADHAAVLALNERSVHFLSPMDAPRLARLAAAAAYFRMIEREARLAAFLLGFRAGADYDSPNFRWFAARGGDFLYVDRIVVDERDRGRGLADELYADFERCARTLGVTCLTCEIDIEPPNPGSLRFHERWGYREVGRQAPYGTKIVSLREKRLLTGATPARPGQGGTR